MLDSSLKPFVSVRGVLTVSCFDQLFGQKMGYCRHATHSDSDPRLAQRRPSSTVSGSCLLAMDNDMSSASARKLVTHDENECTSVRCEKREDRTTHLKASAGTLW